MGPIKRSFEPSLHKPAQELVKRQETRDEFLNLADELLVQIFNLLTLKEASKIRRVCTRFNEMMPEHEIYKTICKLSLIAPSSIGLALKLCWNIQDVMEIYPKVITDNMKLVVALAALPVIEMFPMKLSLNLEWGEGTLFRSDIPAFRGNMSPWGQKAPYISVGYTVTAGHYIETVLGKFHRDVLVFVGDKPIIYTSDSSLIINHSDVCESDVDYLSRLLNNEVCGVRKFTLFDRVDDSGSPIKVELPEESKVESDFFVKLNAPKTL